MGTKNPPVFRRWEPLLEEFLRFVAKIATAKSQCQLPFARRY